jgi:hypothetical protein
MQGDINSGKRTVRRGAVACMIGVVLLIIASGLSSAAMAMIGTVLLVGGFAMAVVGRLNS